MTTLEFDIRFDKAYHTKHTRQYQRKGNEYFSRVIEKYFIDSTRKPFELSSLLALALRRVKYLCMLVSECQANELPLKNVVGKVKIEKKL